VRVCIYVRVFVRVFMPLRLFQLDVHEELSLRCARYVHIFIKCECLSEFTRVFVCIVYLCLKKNKLFQLDVHLLS